MVGFIVQNVSSCFLNDPSDNDRLIHVLIHTFSPQFIYTRIPILALEMCKAANHLNLSVLPQPHQSHKEFSKKD